MVLNDIILNPVSQDTDQMINMRKDQNSQNAISEII